MTRQFRDRLIYSNKEYYLNEEILEYYFNEFPDKKPAFEGYMTALWRGYAAIFEIKDHKLLINQLDWFSTQEDFDHNEFMRLHFPNNQYLWFSGLIRIDDFRGDYDKEDDKDAIFELLEIRKGNLIQHWKLNYEDFQIFKRMIFENFINTDDYKRLFELFQKNNPKLGKEKIDQYIYDGLIRHVREI